MLAVEICARMFGCSGIKSVYVGVEVVFLRFLRVLFICVLIELHLKDMIVQLTMAMMLGRAFQN